MRRRGGAQLGVCASETATHAALSRVVVIGPGISRLGQRTCRLVIQTPQCLGRVLSGWSWDCASRRNAGGMHPWLPDSGKASRLPAARLSLGSILPRMCPCTKPTSVGLHCHDKADIRRSPPKAPAALWMRLRLPRASTDGGPQDRGEPVPSAPVASAFEGAHLWKTCAWNDCGFP